MKYIFLIIVCAIISERFGNFLWSESIREKQRELSIKNEN